MPSLFFSLIMTCIAVSARAEDPPGEPKKSVEQHILETGDAISQKIEKAAEKIDIILAGKKYTKKPNPSEVDIRQLTTFTEGGRLQTSTDFGVNLRLPNVEKRWQLRFTSYDQEKESRDAIQQRVRTQPRERDYGAGLFFFQKIGKVKTSFIPRLQLKDPLEMSYTLRFENTADWKVVQFVPRLDLYADPTKGTGEFLNLEFHYPFARFWEVSWVNTEEYRQKDNFFQTQHTLTFDYTVGDMKGVGTTFAFVSDNRGAFHLDNFTYSLSWNQGIYKDRLSYSVSPFWSFVRDRRYHGFVGISLTVSLVF